MKKVNWPFYLTFILILSLFALGAWWILLILELGQSFTMANNQDIFGHNSAKIISMIKWEGPTFFILIMLISGGLFLMYLQNVRRSKALGLFFASVTHELKTPLASIRLQAEVLQEILQDLGKTRINNLATRLIEDTQKLEVEFDKILQLSKVELGDKLNITQIDIITFINNFISRYNQQLKIKFNHPANKVLVWADEYALTLIFRNLIDNTLIHASTKEKDKYVDIKIRPKDKDVEIIYKDSGKGLDGNVKKLGQLFYKNNKRKGSGIGLYLVNKLIQKMNGQVSYTVKPGLITKINLPLCLKSGDRSC